MVSCGPGRRELSGQVATPYLGQLLHRLRFAVVAGGAGRAGGVAATGADVFIGGRGATIGAGWLLLPSAAQCRHLLPKPEAVRLGQHTRRGTENRPHCWSHAKHQPLANRHVAVPHGQRPHGAKGGGRVGGLRGRAILGFNPRPSPPGPPAGCALGGGGWLRASVSGDSPLRHALRRTVIRSQLSVPCLCLFHEPAQPNPTSTCRSHPPGGVTQRHELSESAAQGKVEVPPAS